jgi:esterase/lipase superfamily enzyme
MGLTHAAVVFSIWLMPYTACAQLQIRVVMDSASTAQGKRLVSEMESRLDSETRSKIKFQASVIPAAETQAVITGGQWDIGVLSTGSLTEKSYPSNVAVFEMPFVFSSASSAIAVQRAAFGRVALANLSEHGMTGLVYLNDGVFRVTSTRPLQALQDFRGRKVVVSSLAQQKAFEVWGSSPVRRPGSEVYAALQTGIADTSVVNSSPASTSIFQIHKYLLDTGIKAQVAVVVTRDLSWAEIPFQYRARIGDIAISFSERLNNEVLETETSFLAKAKASGTTLVSFRKDEAERATRVWINSQPNQMRASYTSALEEIKKAKPTKLDGKSNPNARPATIYFATTREDTGDGSWIYRFGDARTDVVKCGRITFQAGSSAGSGSLVGPVTSDSVKCGAQLNAALEAAPQMLVFIHGFNNRFSEAAERAIVLKRALGPSTEVLLWSWPSKRDGLAGDYRYDKESVSGVEARFTLLRLLKALKAGSEKRPLSVLAHSMGNWVLISVLAELANDVNRPSFRNVAFAAPDVPKDDFVFAIGEMQRAARQMTLYACDADWALAISQRMNSFPRAGTGGAKAIIVTHSDALESVDVNARLLSTNHSYVFEAGKVLTDLVTLVRDGKDPAGRGLQKRTKAPRHYWSF